MIVRKGPALAGLFFTLLLAPFATVGSNTQKLSAEAQQDFRAFVETFAPQVLRFERRGANYRWHSSNRDCAGLVRYLFWEAMQQHDERFLDHYAKMRALSNVSLRRSLGPIVREWQRDNLTAGQLISHTMRISHSAQPQRLKTGDLLYFYSPELKIRHVMLIIRSGAAVLAVYHTGDSRGELRIRTLDDLNALPDAQWHIQPQNPVFQGVFRPRFLD